MVAILEKRIVRLQKDQLCLLLLLAFVGACASMLMFWITARGPGVSTDSVVYIDTAKSLLAGEGFFVRGQPLTHFPSAYPLLLAVAGLYPNSDMLQVARWLHAFLFGANIVLIALAVRMCTEDSLLATGCAMLLFLSSEPVIWVHSMAWSEPPFITFTLAAFVTPFPICCASYYIFVSDSIRFVRPSNGDALCGSYSNSNDRLCSPSLWKSTPKA
jgi:hypothetical protein